MAGRDRTRSRSTTVDTTSFGPKSWLDPTEADGLEAGLAASSDASGEAFADLTFPLEQFGGANVGLVNALLVRRLRSVD